MVTIDFMLDDNEYIFLSNLDTGKAAVEICKLYFRRQNPDVLFPISPNGADLHVLFPGQPGFDIEVKGTERQDIAWQQFKVSGIPSYNMLRDGMRLYRVSNVGSRNLKIYIMKYGEDFEMTPEPRWRVHPLSKGKYPTG